jgi:hypothetical protein
MWSNSHGHKKDPKLIIKSNLSTLYLVGATGLLRLLRIFRAERPFLKTLRQTCLLAGSSPVAPGRHKKALLVAEKDSSFLVGATGFEPATLCSQSRCASQAAPRPVSKRRRQTITNSTPVNTV